MKPVPAHTDPELVALLKKKDPEAFIFLYEKYAGALYGLIEQVLGSTGLADETFVEAFTTIVRSIDQHDSSKSRLFTWMMQLTREWAIEKLKSTSPRTYSEAEVREPGVKVVGGLMSNLHIDEQQVINLAYLKGYSVEEMAGKLAIPPEVVKQRINKALIAINSQVKK
ncbi:MAG TPA: sigma factor-like helix-turn-helix DNA-binding protein [Chitinophagaceae bacterium]|nr:sigma factor-like helix-turn-helix DNA-binding protein [Chitinophagaceae bacterium]